MSAKTSTESFGGMAIFVVVFLALWITLMILMPSSFYVMSKTYSDYDVPDYFTQEDIQHIKHFENGTLTRGNALGVPVLTLDFNPDANFKFNIRWYYDSLVGKDWIIFSHVTWEWLMFFSEDDMTLTTKDYTQITLSELQEYWDSNINATVFYPTKCQHITTKVWVTDTNSTRDDIEEAWNDGQLNIGMGFGFDDYETKLGAWDIVGRLLTFQSPQIFGLTGAFATVVNLIITLPFYVCVAYLIYRLILLAIPFV